VWEGKEVVKYGRTMIGTTNPLASPPGTIRGDFGIDTGRNIVHGSDSVDVSWYELVCGWWRGSGCRMVVDTAVVCVYTLMQCGSGTVFTWTLPMH
jgi:hypothetical protein